MRRRVFLAGDLVASVGRAKRLLVSDLSRIPLPRCGVTAGRRGRSLYFAG